MKTFKLIGTALLAVVMCAGFASCSDDDDGSNDGGIVTNQKKLMEIKDGGYTYSFSYDNQGRLTSVDTYGGMINFTWGNNTIIATDEYGKTTYTLSNNLVREQEDEKVFTYNSSNQLIRVDEVEERDGIFSTYVWDNRKMTKYIYNYSSDSSDEPSVYEYTYNGKTCKGWFPNMADESWDPVDDDYIFFAHPELVGMRNNQLPEQIKDDEGDIQRFTYTFDKDGYVKSCTVTDGADDTDATTYTFKWE